MVEGTGLENRQARKRLEGSNPSPSASNYRKRFYSQVLSVYMDGLAIFLPTIRIDRFVSPCASCAPAGRQHAPDRHLKTATHLGGLP